MKNLELAEKYFEIINSKFHGLNLTSHSSSEEILEKQIVDSVFPFEYSKELADEINKAKLIIDLGFGGGFPILPLANKFKNKNFLGIETRNKKVEAVREISDQLGLKNIKLITGRIENFEFDDANTLIVNKAVGPIDRILNYITPTAPIGVMFYKGPSFIEKEQQLIEHLPKCWALENIFEIPLPKMEKRYMIHFKGNPISSVPRRTNKLVKLSTRL